MFVSDGTIYATSGGGLSISSDGGTTWTNYTTANGLPTNFLRDVYVSDGTVYIGSDQGITLAQLPVPAAVPGPLPLAGAAAAFSVSRRLRRRLRTAGTMPSC